MSEQQSFSCVLAEDEARIRKNLKAKIESIDPRFQIVFEAADGSQAAQYIAEHEVDLLLTDIRMPVKNGLELIEEVYYGSPQVLCVIVSGYDDFTYAKRAIRFGVVDYLLKPIDPGELSVLLYTCALRLEKLSGQLSEDLIRYDSSLAQQELAENLAEYLRLHYREKISVAQAAAALGVHPTYLSRTFKSFTGKSPTRFILDLRLGHAKRLFTEQPDCEIKEIAFEVGYTDQGYFSRIFKKYTGMSPSEYREQSRGTQ